MTSSTRRLRHVQRRLIQWTGVSALACMLSACGGGNGSGNSSAGLIPTAHVAVVIEGIDTNSSLTQDANTGTTITADEPSSIAIWGKNLRPDLQVKLGTSPCNLKDLDKFDDLEAEDDTLQIIADCPAQSVGTLALTVTDGTQQLYQTSVSVQKASTAAQRVAFTKSLRPVFFQPDHSNIARTNGFAPPPGSSSSVNGQIRAEAPTINIATGGLDFSQVKTFPVRGVVVKLLDADNGNAVLGVTATDSAGNYAFDGIVPGKKVTVEVDAQLAKTRAGNTASGPQYNFMLRDNTGPGDFKPLYTLNSTPVTTVAGSNTISLTATIGYDNAGQVIGPRQSAPFAILDVVYNAVTDIQTANPDIVLQDLNIYWSTNNVGIPGDKMQGQIGTSHFTDGGDYPGVYILGKADVDTDEFDRGVVGHEFGHYLQFVVSYADNPGGRHANDEYKDASLAYGEGFGTAIGGLLARSKYYSDSSGPKSAGGSVSDISQPVPSGQATGFYSEASVYHVLYTIGTKYGFSTFWKTTTALASGHESATVFNFLSRFVAQNPSALSDIQSIAAADNIRTLDALGALPTGAAADPSVNAMASNGAGDLEVLYLPLNLSPWATNATSSMNVTQAPSSFCFNSNLKGAMFHNGLGMSRRFTFVAPQTGWLGLRMTDATGAANSTTLIANARDDTGQKVDVYVWGTDVGKLSVIAGRRYSVKLTMINPASLAGGNACGITLTAWNAV